MENNSEKYIQAINNKVYNYRGYIRRINKEVFGNSLSSLKRQASIVANDYYNSLDEMDVYFRGKKMFCLYRLNKKTPSGAWEAGEWR